MKPTKKYTTERKTLIAVCSLGILKLSQSIWFQIKNDIGSEIALVQYLLVFLMASSIFIALVISDISYLSIFLSLALTLLLSFSWILTGGLEGISEYNLMALLIVIPFLNKGKSALVLTALVICVQIALVFVWEYRFDLIQSTVLPYVYDEFNFQVTLVVLTLCFAFMAYNYDLRKRDQLDRSVDLNSKLIDLQTENERLESQEEELNQMNEILTEMIEQRIRTLTKQNQSLNSYLDLSVIKMEPSVNKLNKCTEDIALDSELAIMMKESVKDLNSAFIKSNSKNGYNGTS